MLNLEKIWKQRATDISINPMPGRIYDFVKFLGAESKEKLEHMDFTQLEKLPGVVKREIKSYGGCPESHEKYGWKWVMMSNGKYHLYNQHSYGIGNNYNDAALDGLLSCWELLTYRRKQNNPGYWKRLALHRKRLRKSSQHKQHKKHS